MKLFIGKFNIKLYKNRNLNEKKKYFIYSKNHFNN